MSFLYYDDIYSDDENYDNRLLLEAKRGLAQESKIKNQKVTDHL